MKTFKTSFVSLCFVLFASTLWAEEHMHTLNLQDTEIRLLVETVSDITGKNFVIDPEVTGKITVISGQPIPEDKVYDLFLSIKSPDAVAQGGVSVDREQVAQPVLTV